MLFAPTAWAGVPPPAAASACSATLPEAGEILLPGEAVRPGQETHLEVIPAADLSQTTFAVIARDSGTAVGEPPAKAERFLGSLRQGSRIAIEVRLPEHLEIRSKSRSLIQGIDQEVADTRRVDVIVQGILADGRIASSRAALAFEPVGDGSFRVVRLTDFLRQRGVNGGRLQATEKVPTAGGEIFKSERGNSKQVGIFGWINFRDSNGATAVLPAAEVTVWEADGSQSNATPLTTVLTQSNGSFQVEVWDPAEIDGELELFLTVRLVNPALRIGLYDNPNNVNCASTSNFCGLADEDNIFEWTGPTGTGFTPGLHLMAYTVADSASRGAAQIWAWLNDAVDFTDSVFDPGQVRAVWPRPGQGSFALADFDYNLVLSAAHHIAENHEVALHEFGHLVMYRRNPYVSPGAFGFHWLYELLQPSRAWSEGFATAFAQFVRPDGYYDDLLGGEQRFPVENAHEATQTFGTYPPNTATEHNEMWVAAALLDLYDTGEPAASPADDPADGTMSYALLVDLIRLHDIDSILELYDRLLERLGTTDRHFASRVLRANNFDVPLEPLTLVLYPDADAFVAQTWPSVNFGFEDHLRIRLHWNGIGRFSFLRFQVPEYVGTITSAKLKLRTQGDSVADASFYRVPGMQWNESTVTWDNWDQTGTAFYMRKILNLAPNAWHEVSVLEGVVGSGPATLGITSAVDQANQDFWSRESVYKPQLILEIGE